MTLRERLLALLRADNFTPADEFGLCRQLGLRQQARASVRKEIESLLKAGLARRDSRGRLLPVSKPTRQAAPAPAATRAVFTPTRRGPTMPPPGSPSPFAKSAKPVAASVANAAPAPASSEPKLKQGESVGRIQFRLGGSAYVVREGAAGEVGLQIAPDDTDVALPGDRVIVRELVGRRGRRPGACLSASGTRSSVNSGAGDVIPWCCPMIRASAARSKSPASTSPSPVPPRGKETRSC